MSSGKLRFELPVEVYVPKQRYVLARGRKMHVPSRFHRGELRANVSNRKIRRKLPYASTTAFVVTRTARVRVHRDSPGPRAATNARTALTNAATRASTTWDPIRAIARVAINSIHSDLRVRISTSACFRAPVKERVQTYRARLAAAVQPDIRSIQSTVQLVRTLISARRTTERVRATSAARIARERFCARVRLEKVSPPTGSRAKSFLPDRVL